MATETDLRAFEDAVRSALTGLSVNVRGPILGDLEERALDASAWDQIRRRLRDEGFEVVRKA